MITVTLSLLLIASTQAASAKNITAPQCPEGKYYDHGTNYCEPCTDICDKAEYKKTVQQCQEQCPKMYAQLMNKEQKPAVGLSTEKDSEGLSTAALAAIISGSIGVVAVVIIAVAVRKLRPGQHSSGGAAAARVQYSPAGVEEENGEQAASERRSQTEGLLPRGFCDPRVLFGDRQFHAEETPSGRRGKQEQVLLGSSQESGIQEASQQAMFVVSPIYKPSGSMVSTSRV